MGEGALPKASRPAWAWGSGPRENILRTVTITVERYPEGPVLCGGALRLTMGAFRAHGFVMFGTAAPKTTVEGK